MAAKETSIIDENKKPIKESEIIISIKLPASEAIRLVGQIYGQIGDIGYVSGESKEQYKKHFTSEEESST